MPPCQQGLAMCDPATLDGVPDDGACRPANLPPDIWRGIEYLKGELKTLSRDPGVYRMLNGVGEVLYVGKARNLTRRVGSYTQPNRLSNRIMRMVSETEKLEVIVTKSEIEALLLESNLIKKMNKDEDASVESIGDPSPAEKVNETVTSAFHNNHHGKSR